MKKGRDMATNRLTGSGFFFLQKNKTSTTISAKRLSYNNKKTENKSVHTYSFL